jgi:hypothetical protein
VAAGNCGKGEGEDLRALRLMDIHIIQCNDRFPGASAATGSISEEANGWLPEMAAKAKERISGLSTRWIYT